MTQTSLSADSSWERCGLSTPKAVHFSSLSPGQGELAGVPFAPCEILQLCGAWRAWISFTLWCNIYSPQFNFIMKLHHFSQPWFIRVDEPKVPALPWYEMSIDKLFWSINDRIITIFIPSHSITVDCLLHKNRKKVLVYGLQVALFRRYLVPFLTFAKGYLAYFEAQHSTNNSMPCNTCHPFWQNAPLNWLILIPLALFCRFLLFCKLLVDSRNCVWKSNGALKP